MHCRETDALIDASWRPQSWSVKDRWNNEIILANERWQHIINGHWELANLCDQVLDTVRLGTHKQNETDPNKYRDLKKFSDSPYGYTHILVIVRLLPNKFVITACPKRVR